MRQPTTALGCQRLRNTLPQSRFEQRFDVIADGTAVVNGHQLGQKRMGPKRVVQGQTPLQCRGLPRLVLFEIEPQPGEVAGDQRPDQRFSIPNLLIQRPRRDLQVRRDATHVQALYAFGVQEFQGVAKDVIGRDQRLGHRGLLGPNITEW